MSDIRHSRRQAIRSIVQFAAIANPLSGRLLLAFASSPLAVAASVDRGSEAFKLRYPTPRDDWVATAA